MKYTTPNMQTIAYKFMSACMAGLILSGVDDYGEIEWLGTGKQFTLARLNEMLFEEGLLPNKLI